MRSGVTFDGNEHRKQAKQLRKRAFVTSLEEEQGSSFI